MQGRWRQQKQLFQNLNFWIQNKDISWHAWAKLSSFHTRASKNIILSPLSSLKQKDHLISLRLFTQKLKCLKLFIILILVVMAYNTKMGTSKTNFIPPVIELKSQTFRYSILIVDSVNRCFYFFRFYSLIIAQGILLLISVF